ncbi:MAG TPA: carboxymuconolactone decarboxylase family protein [Candidatus Binataceae bacterium]|nr:carboxymuconolactone decarboxylase family protein [Candidatus Binataceae bacterium]
MARVPYLERDDLPEEHRKIYDKLTAERGAVWNLFRALAHAPGVLAALLDLSHQLRHRTKLDPKLRELAILTVGRLAESQYEFDHHWNMALKLGIPREKLEKLAHWETAPIFTDEERAVIRFAVESTRDIKVNEATFNALRNFLDNERIVELTMEVAMYNAIVRVLLPLHVELEQDFVKN